MSRYVDIAKLTQEVLASVEEEQREKTAAESEPELKTVIGSAIKQAAGNIRNYTDTVVTNDDLQTILAGTKLALLGGGLAGGAAGAAMGSAVGATLGSVVPVGGTIVGGAIGGIYGGIKGMNSGPTPGAANRTQGGAVQPTQAVNPQAQQMRTASLLGNQLRKLATQIRNQGANNEEIRLTKAAQMLTAAVGLGHLTKGLS